MSGEIKILIISDLHLGLETEGFSISKETRFNTFKKIVQLAREHDFLFMAGDLLHDENMSSDILDGINKELKGLRKAGNISVYVPGFSEMDGDGNIRQAVFDIGVNHLFSTVRKPESIKFNIKGQDICIYGMPASKDFDILKIKKEPVSGFHIGLFHSDCDFKNIRMEPNSGGPNGKTLSGLDFYALGYNHFFRMFRVMNRIIGIYPGSPEAADINEKGDRYAVSITVSNNRISNLRRLCINSVNVIGVEFDCSGTANFDEFMKELEKKRSGKDYLVLSLTGLRKFRIDSDIIDKEKNYFYDISITDKTIPSVQLIMEDYINEDTIRGEFYRILKERIDKRKTPAGLNIEDLSLSLHILTEDESGSMEEWLCNMSNA